MSTCTELKFVRYGCRVYFYRLEDGVVAETKGDLPLNSDFQIVKLDGGGLLFVFDGSKVVLSYNQISEFVTRNTVTDAETPLNFADEDEFILYLEQERNTCSEIQVSVPGLSPPSEANVLPNDISTSTAGSTTAGALEVAVANVGSSAGTFNGISIPAGYTRTYSAVLDAANEVFYRVASMNYDASGTTFIISEIL